MNDKPATMADLDSLQLRVGTVVRAEVFAEARKPAYKLWVDIGNSQIRQSSAQITAHYTAESLLGMQVVCVCGFEPKQIGPWMSEVLVTGFHDANGHVVLCVPHQPVPNGTQLK